MFDACFDHVLKMDTTKTHFMPIFVSNTMTEDMKGKMDVAVNLAVNNTKKENFYPCISNHAPL